MMILLFLTFDFQYLYLEYSQSEGSYMYSKALVAIFILLDFEIVQNSLFWLVDIKINEKTFWSFWREHHQKGEKVMCYFMGS